MADLHPPFLPSKIYHVYNHANGDDDLFREEDNYRYFLEKYQKYISPVADTLAYCLMKNHFHLMVRVKTELELSKTFKVFENLEGLPQEKPKLLEEKISQSFSNLFNSYTKAFNKNYDRRGSLFIPRVKRKEITNDAYFTHCIVYIHQNPVLHGFIDNLADWKHSSYWGILNGHDPISECDEILSWFGGRDNFIEAHKQDQPFHSVFD